jgi:hypothetical protein
VFNVSPPSGAKIVRVASPAAGAAQRSLKARKGHKEITGLAAVARRVHFKLRAPGSLVGLPRRSATLLDWGGTPAAVLAYGQNLGGIAVIERAADRAKPIAPASGERQGLSLPTVSINGVTGQELDTALGTAITFTRAGISYIVVGSVPPTAAEAAARAL